MNKTITVIRGNVVLDITPEEKDYYVNNGYSVIDENGNFIEKAMSNDVKTLQLEVARLNELVAQKDEELKKLKNAKPKTKKTEE